MSKEKQIEEMAVIIEQANEQAVKNPRQLKILGQDWFGKWYASALYEAGCRMQSEGEWVLIGNGNGRAIHWKCSVCGYETLDASNGDTNFCPNCGADMRGRE